ncbi:MAG: hypothetical protein ABH883_03965 [Candidatus Omnitrophota bacterium]
MKKVRGIISGFVLITFSFSGSVYADPGMIPGSGQEIIQDLSAGSIFSDLKGAEAEMLGSVKLALQTNLMNLGVEEITEDVIKKMVVNDVISRKDTIFNPDQMNFFFSNSLEKLPNGYFCVKCRVLEKGSETEYKDCYAVFSKNKNTELNAFSIEVYKEEEWQEWLKNQDSAKNIPPKRADYKKADAEAIARYAEHEKSFAAGRKAVDEFIKMKMEAGDYAAQSDIRARDANYSSGKFSYSKEDQDRLAADLGKTLTAAGMGQGAVKQLEKMYAEKPLIIIPYNKASETLPAVTMYNEKNEPVPVAVDSHSSDNATYFFMEEGLFLGEMGKSGNAAAYREAVKGAGLTVTIYDASVSAARQFIQDRLLYEAGVWCGQMGRVDKNGMLANALTEAKAEYDKAREAYKPASGIKALKPVGSLSEISVKRDYAAGTGMLDDKAAEEILGKIIDGKDLPAGEDDKALLNWADRLAAEVGALMARPLLDNKYTLFMCDEFFAKKDEEKNDMAKWGSVFNLVRLDKNNPQGLVQVINKMVKEMGLKPEEVIVQLPKGVDEDTIEKLLEKNPGIKYMVVDVGGLSKESDVKKSVYRQSMYSMMLLSRRLNKEKSPENYKITRLLRLYISAFTGKKGAEIDEYIEAMIENTVQNIAQIVNMILSYKPIKRLDGPDFELIAETLRSA